MSWGRKLSSVWAGKQKKCAALGGWRGVGGLCGGFVWLNESVIIWLNESGKAKTHRRVSHPPQSENRKPWAPKMVRIRLVKGSARDGKWAVMKRRKRGKSGEDWDVVPAAGWGVINNPLLPHHSLEPCRGHQRSITTPEHRLAHQVCVCVCVTLQHQPMCWMVHRHWCFEVHPKFWPAHVHTWGRTYMWSNSQWGTFKAPRENLIMMKDLKLMATHFN